MKSQLRILQYVVLLMSTQVIVLPAQAASFDCAQARTHIEKMICANTKLSDLDDQLGKVYSQALKKAPEPEALIRRQRDWLKDLRKYCHSKMCVQRAYTTRIAAIQNGDGAKAYVMPARLAEREANKAAKIKAVLRTHTMNLTTYIHAKPAQIALCKSVYSALRNGDSSIKYVEPVLRTNDPANPGLSAYNACNLKKLTMLELGTTGFRLYRLKQPGNPHGKVEEYLFGENPKDTFRTIPAALIKVNFKTCKIMDEVPAYSSHPLPNYNPDYGTNAMILYHNRYFFLDLSRIGESEYYSLDVWEHSMKRHMFLPKNLCAWSVPLKTK